MCGDEVAIAWISPYCKSRTVQYIVCFETNCLGTAIGQQEKAAVECFIAAALRGHC